jgi:sugar O-acyltransferase (sialic acid O-acetyltransferase NeuD family)
MSDRQEENGLCAILGGGGHARVLIDCLQLSGCPRRLMILDPDSTRWGQQLYGVPIVGDDDKLEQLGAEWFVVAFGSVGDNRPRQQLFDRCCALGLEPLTVLHPQAVVSRWATLERGAQVLPGSVINAGSRIGANAIVNSGAVIEHDCVLGDHAHVATGARLGGGVRVGWGAHVGIGATVRQGICVGDRAIVGAGAVVVKDVSSGTTVVGVPARPVIR